jgi:hypothetical protein
MKIVQILIKSTTCNSEVLVDLKNIESPHNLGKKKIKFCLVMHIIAHAIFFQEF